MEAGSTCSPGFLVIPSSQGATQASTCKVDRRLAEPIGRELLSSIGRLLRKGVLQRGSTWAVFWRAGVIRGVLWTTVSSTVFHSVFQTVWSIQTVCDDFSDRRMTILAPKQKIRWMCGRRRSPPTNLACRRHSISTLGIRFNYIELAAHVPYGDRLLR